MKTLLKNGMVIDGSGAEAFKADVMLDGELILKIAPDFEAEADRVVDCEGKTVAPGFIDAHSHNDWFLKHPGDYFTPFLMQGMTTQVTGNCGFSPFGYPEDTRYVKDIGGYLFTKDDADYSTFEKWYDRNSKTYFNIVPLHGHGTARIGVNGYANAKISQQDKAKVMSLVEGAYDSGVFGTSLGLMYQPGCFSDAGELEEVAGIAGKRGGILSFHLKACSAVSTSYGLPFGGAPHNIRAMKEAFDICAKAGCKLQISHLIYVGGKTWKTFDESLRLLEEMRKSGVNYRFDMYASTFGASVITVILPPWYLLLSPKERSKGFVRARLSFEINLTRKLLGFDFSDIQIAYISDEISEYNGMFVSEIAKKMGISDLDAYLKLVDLSGGEGRVLMGKYYNTRIINELASRNDVFYMTDAWIEASGLQNAAAFGTFPKFLQLSREGAIAGLENTVRKMTGAIADWYGIAKRGYIREGYFADITVFDSNTVSGSVEVPEAPKGITHVFINGDAALLESQVTDSFGGSGRILKKA